MAEGSAENYGPLPTLLVLLTIITGFVDAVTYLQFGHVFVANMTGNVVFLGFAVAGAQGISIGGSLVALAAFLVGALLGGVLGQRFAHHRGYLLAWSSLLKVLLLLIATVVAALGASPYGIIPELGITMGIQNAMTRKLAIPDLTTTVLTMTLTGIAADSSLAGGHNVRLGRRILSVIVMFVGALAGGAIVLRLGVVPALAVASAIMATVSVAAYSTSRGNPEWVKA